MNTNSNTYTVIYSTVLVVVVAAVLAFAAMALKPMQDENVKKETITQVLTAAAQPDADVTISEDTNVMEMYVEKITDAFYVDGNGNRKGQMNMGKEEPQLTSRTRMTSSRRLRPDRLTFFHLLSFRYMSLTSTVRKSL